MKMKRRKHPKVRPMIPRDRTGYPIIPMMRPQDDPNYDRKVIPLTAGGDYVEPLTVDTPVPELPWKTDDGIMDNDDTTI